MALYFPGSNIPTIRPASLALGLSLTSAKTGNEIRNKKMVKIKKFLTSSYDDRFIENVQLFERVKHITVFDGEFFTFW